MTVKWGIDVINRHGTRTCVPRDMLPTVREGGAYLVDPRRRDRDGGPTLLDLAGCGIGDCIAALPTVDWLASPGEGREHSVWVRCPAKCAFLFADRAARVITTSAEMTDNGPDGCGLVLDVRAALQQAGLHTGDEYCTVEVIAELAGCRPATPKLELKPQLDGREYGDWAGLLLDHGKDPGKPVVLLQPISAAAGKDWPLSSWLALVNRLQAAGVQVVYTHSDSVDWPSPAAGYTRCRALVGDPIETVAAWASAADLVVSGDSFCFHLAAAVGKPSIGLFGPTDGQAMAKHYPLARVIQSSDPGDMGRIGISLVESYCKEEING